MFDVEIVMPVYNEAECIGDVLNDWTAELGRLKINYCLLVLNDGSRDNTAAVLEHYALSPRIKVINKPNSGHGSTI